MTATPVLLVHGIWDTAATMAPLKRGLERRGVRTVQAIDLVPRRGRAPIAVFGECLGRAVESFAAETGAARVDVVGFSMGALVTRWYVQRGAGKDRVRRFVSISGPHHGTYCAYALPFASVRQMRPGSAFLQDLAADPDPFGPVEVHCVYTPLDLMIVPATSSVLGAAKSVRSFVVALHSLMLWDGRVLDHVAGVLGATG